MIYVIGHRGAPRRALENTAASFKEALALGVQAIEFDVRKTKDGELVVLHDASLDRVAGDPRKVREMRLSELKALRLTDGSEILTLAEALQLTNNLPVIIEIKDSGSARRVLEVIKPYRHAHTAVASFKLKELAYLRHLDPTLQLYGLDRTRALEFLHLAKIFQLDGVGFNFWLLNPLTYLRARLQKLELYVYTVNSPFIARYLHVLYPKVKICTDRPEQLVPKKKGWRSHVRALGPHRKTGQ